MSDRVSMPLINQQQAHRAVGEVWQLAKSMLDSGTRLVLELREENRTLDQNAHFHALCTDIAKAGVQWAGKPRKASEWKVLLVSGHAVATKEGSDMVPGLEGEYVNLRDSTARMGKRRAASLIEYTLAFCAANGVVMRAGKQWEGWQ